MTVDEIFPTGIGDSDAMFRVWPEMPEVLTEIEVLWVLDWLFEPGEAVNHINRSICPLQDLPPINAFSADCRVVYVTQAEQLREGFKVISWLWASVSSRTTDESSPNDAK